MGPVNIDWAVAQRPLKGQMRSGDAHLVTTFDGGALVAAIDGLGHGTAAADAAQLAVEVLKERPDAPVAEHLLRCHERLKGTRGVVMSVARFDAARSELTWGGVGNVEGVLARADRGAHPRRHSLVVFGGIVGGQLAGVRTSALPVRRGDVLMFATDGVRADVIDEAELFGEPQEVAQRALTRWGRGTDDALVLVARWLGAGR